MSESMIKRVADAMAERGVNDPGLAKAVVDWGDYARAAIKAMREPTREMDGAGYDVEGLPGWTADRRAETHLNVWRAMIDAALKEEDPADHPGGQTGP